jgi:hypothetical protein
MGQRDRRILLGLTALMVGLVVAQAVTGVEVMMASPALVLALPLLAGRYVGEERLARLVARFEASASRAARTLTDRLPRAPRAVLPRGGRLLAASLAERGPPWSLAAR